MNHLGDTNKMVDTPRTDAEYERLFEIYRNWERKNEPLCCSFENDMRLCRQLERELNAANDRIKRLEEAGNALLWYFCPKNTGDISFLQSEAIKQWNKAKEDKL